MAWSVPIRQAVLIAAMLCCAAAPRLAAQPPADSSAVPPECRRGDPLAGVHHPARLEVVAPCLEVTGTVTRARRSPDGDLKFNLQLAPADEHLLNDYNRREQGATLICEIVPADQSGCRPGSPVVVNLGLIERVEGWLKGPFDFGICSGANLAMPPVGARVKVVGPYVIDHGWMEIHPVWAIESVTAGGH